MSAQEDNVADAGFRMPFPYPPSKDRFALLCIRPRDFGRLNGKHNSCAFPGQILKERRHFCRPHGTEAPELVCNANVRGTFILHGILGTRSYKAFRNFFSKYLLLSCIGEGSPFNPNSKNTMSNNQNSLAATDHPPIPQEAFDWYDEYAHGVIDRRTFVNRLSTVATASLTMSVLLSALTPDYAQAEQVSFNDPDIKATYATFPSPNGHGEGRGYLVKPNELEEKAPVVLVIHENRGLNPYIKDVARRVAKAGFIGFAPDALHPKGGYPGNDDEGRSMQRSLDRAKIEADFVAAARFLKEHGDGSGKLGAVGFCFGGYIVNMLAAVIPDDLNAGIPFYGTPAAKEIRRNIKAPLLIQLAELDKRVNASWPEYEEDLKAAKIDYTMHMYEKANHGFHNDSTGRYDEKMATLAWDRTIAFFKKHLGVVQ